MRWRSCVPALLVCVSCKSDDKPKTSPPQPSSATVAAVEFESIDIAGGTAKARVPKGWVRRDPTRDAFYPPPDNDPGIEVNELYFRVECAKPECAPATATEAAADFDKDEVSWRLEDPALKVISDTKDEKHRTVVIDHSGGTFSVPEVMFARWQDGQPRYVRGFLRLAPSLAPQRDAFVRAIGELTVSDFAKLP